MVKLAVFQLYSREQVKINNTSCR